MVSLLLIEIWVALYSLMSKVSFVEARLHCVLRRLLLLKRTDNAPISDILFGKQVSTTRHVQSFFLYIKIKRFLINFALIQQGQVTVYTFIKVKFIQV